MEGIDFPSTGNSSGLSPYSLTFHQVFMTSTIVLAICLFLIGSTIRIVRVATMPVNVRWELYPLPANHIAKIRVMLSEIFLLRGVFDQNKLLWLPSWLFHCSLYLMLLMSGLLPVASVSGSARIVITPVVEVVAVITFVCGTAGTAGLIVLRLGSLFRPFASFSAISNLLCLFAIFLSGLVFVFAQPAAADTMIMQAGSLFRLNPAPELPLSGTVHLGLLALFIAYFPYTAMAHAMLKYFTYHWVRWDDRSAARTPELSNRMRRYLAYPVHWSALHIRVEKGANWAETLNPDHKERM
jgi:nitrate reductase gamma subunit